MQEERKGGEERTIWHEEQKSGRKPTGLYSRDTWRDAEQRAWTGWGGGLGKKEGVVSEKTRCLVKTADVVQALNQTAVVQTVIVTSTIYEARWWLSQGDVLAFKDQQWD